MNANQQSISVRNARLLSIFFSIFIGILGALIGYSLATLTGILIFQDLNDILGDINIFAISMFCCYGWPMLLVCGLIVGLPISMLGTHFHWCQSITNFSILLVSAILGAMSGVALNAFGLFSFFALGGLE